MQSDDQQKKTWAQPQLTVISYNNIAGGGVNSAHNEQTHFIKVGTKYKYATKTSSTAPLGVYNSYVHS